MPELPPWFGNVADAMGIFTFFAATYAAFNTWRLKRRLDRRLQTIPWRGERRDVALAVGIGGSIKGEVEHYLQAQGQPVPVVEIEHPQILRREQVPDLLNELHRYKRELAEQGTTGILLFYRGPVVIATFLGALCDNWVPVRVFARNDQGGYEELLTISRETTVARV
ncbi:MAG: SAVED domain-containing protein [Chloroflexota bacterium]